MNWDQFDEIFNRIIDDIIKGRHSNTDQKIGSDEINARIKRLKKDVVHQVAQHNPLMVDDKTLIRRLSDVHIIKSRKAEHGLNDECRYRN